MAPCLKGFSKQQSITQVTEIGLSYACLSDTVAKLLLSPQYESLYSTVDETMFPEIYRLKPYVEHIKHIAMLAMVQLRRCTQSYWDYIMLRVDRR